MGRSKKRKPTRRPPTATLLTLALLSGASALIFETVWLRSFRLLFGNTAYAATATLCAFFAGLAIGAALIGHWSRRATHPLRSYMWIEVGVAGTALLWAPLAIALYGPLYGFLYDGLADHRGVFVAVKFALALAAMLPTTILLGGTLPMLATALSEQRFALGREGTRLYAINTLGAALGAAAGALFLPEWIGIPLTYSVGVIATLAVAATARQLARQQETARPASKRAARPAPARSTTARAPLDALLLAFGSGFGVLASEVLLMHGLGQDFSHSAYSVGTVLLVVLVSLAVSALLVSATSAWSSTGALLRGVALLTAALLVLMPAGIRALPDAGGPGVMAILQAFGLDAYWTAILFVMASALPLFIVSGLIFPLTFRLAADGPAGPRLGGLLAANTVGGILGAISASFLFLAHVGLWTSWGWLAALYALAAIVVPGRLPARLATAAIALVVGTAVLISPMSPWQYSLVTLREGETVLALKEGPHGVVSVIEQPDGNRRIKVDDRYEFGSSNAQPVSERMGHLPLLFHPDPKRVAYVGSATGGVAAAAVIHPVERIDLIEIVPEVHELAAEHFGAVNRAVHADPRSRLVQEDGRNHLRAAPERYDVVVEDVFVPYRPSATAMYSRDHYQDVKRHLTDDGVFCQYLPIYQLSQRTLEMITAGFLEVFPEATLWRPHLKLHIPVVGLVGFRGETPAVADLAARAQALKALGVEDRWVTHPRGLWLMYAGPAAALLQGPRPRIHRDGHPAFDFLVARDHPEDIRRFTYAGWPRLTWSLEERAEGRDPIFPGRPQPMFQAANAFVRVNMAFTARKADVAKDAWLDVRRLVPPELLSTRDSSFSDVWAD